MKRVLNPGPDVELHEIDRLRARIDRLQARIDRLQARIDHLTHVMRRGRWEELRLDDPCTAQHEILPRKYTA